MMQRGGGAFDRKLFEQVKKGNPHATEQFLSPYMPLIRSLSKRFYCSALSAQDLCQAGYLGLIHAIRRYNPEMQAEFPTYAVPWILGEMKKALRNAVDSTGAVRRSRKIMRDVHTLSVELGREPRMREIAEYCNVSAAEIMHILESASLPVSLDGSSEADERSLMDTLSGGSGTDLDTLDIRMALSGLPEKERQVIILRYYRDYTQKETAAILKCSQAQASRIERRALDCLRQVLD